MLENTRGLVGGALLLLTACGDVVFPAVPDWTTGNARPDDDMADNDAFDDATGSTSHGDSFEGEETTGGEPGVPSTEEDVSWVVGEAGAMLRIDSAGPSERSESTGADLLAIGCLGAEASWVVGREGTVLNTSDGGASWQDVSLGTTATLRSIDISDDGVVYIAGDGGAIFVDSDGTGAFEPLDAPDVDFSDVAVSADGSVAYLSSFDGRIWRHVSGGSSVSVVFIEPTEVFTALDVSGDGTRIVAVGEFGIWVESSDEGNSWIRRNSVTTHDLHAVVVGSQRDLAMAVGEAGVMVRFEGERRSVRDLLGPKQALRALHVSSSGRAMAVGDGGVALESANFGLDWTPVELPTTANLLALDELGAGSHL